MIEKAFLAGGLRLLSPGHLTGFAASQHMVHEQIHSDRLDHLYRPCPPSYSVLVAAQKQNTNTASVMLAYMADASSCSTQSKLLCRPDILIEYQTFGIRDMLSSYNFGVLSQQVE